jgi:MazG family protein
VAFVAIAGLATDAREVPAGLADRLSRASGVFVADPHGHAAALLASSGIAARPVADLGPGGAGVPDGFAAAAIRAATASGPARDEVFVVVDGDLPILPMDAHPDFAGLVRIMSALRDPEGGCPWDLEQTHETLKPNMIEEAYEVVDAIDAGSDSDLAEELGDVLLQIAFHAQMAAEAGTFTIDDVAAGIVAKLVHRHPHIFGDVEAGSAQETLRRWDQLKKAEKPHRSSALDGIPSRLPSLMAAQKISRRVVAHGFEWEDTEGVYEKLAEELEELRATAEGTPEAREEIGDLLFTVVNLARKYQVDAEQALRETNEKFARRWRWIEAAAAEEGTPPDELGIERLEELWRAAKAHERDAGEGAALREDGTEGA